MNVANEPIRCVDAWALGQPAQVACTSTVASPCPLHFKKGWDDTAPSAWKGACWSIISISAYIVHIIWWSSDYRAQKGDSNRQIAHLLHGLADIL